MDAQVAEVGAARAALAMEEASEFVFVLAVVMGVYGLVAAGVQAARLRARLIYPQAGMAAGVYPLVSTPQGVIEPPAPRLATRREPPALTAATPQGLIEPPAPSAPPDQVDLRTWQGDGLPLGVSAAGPVSVPLDGSWSLGLVAGLPGMEKSTALRWDGRQCRPRWRFAIARGLSLRRWLDAGCCGRPLRGRLTKWPGC